MISPILLSDTGSVSSLFNEVEVHGFHPVMCTVITPDDDATEPTQTRGPHNGGLLLHVFAPRWLIGERSPFRSGFARLSVVPWGLRFQIGPQTAFFAPCRSLGRRVAQRFVTWLCFCILRVVPGKPLLYERSARVGSVAENSRHRASVSVGCSKRGLGFFAETESRQPASCGAPEGLTLLRRVDPGQTYGRPLA